MVLVLQTYQDIFEHLKAECLVLPITQEAVCIHSVVLAIEIEVQRIFWRLNLVLIWYKCDLR